MSFLTQSHQVFFRRPLCLNSFNFPRYTMFHPVIVIFSFNMSKPSQPRPKSSLSSLLLFLSFSQLNPTHPSDHTHFSAIHLQFKLYYHRPGLTAMHQTTHHTSSGYLAFQLVVVVLMTITQATLTIMIDWLLTGGVFVWHVREAGDGLNAIWCNCRRLRSVTLRGHLNDTSLLIMTQRCRHLAELSITSDELSLNGLISAMMRANQLRSLRVHGNAHLQVTHTQR